MSRLDDARRRAAANERNAKIAKAARYWLSCRDEYDQAVMAALQLATVNNEDAVRMVKHRLATAEADLATTIRKYQP